jgi:hypothetical protein
MEKIDYKKIFKIFYQPKASVVSIVDIPAFNYLMIDGQGDPNYSVDYQQAVEALFSLSYTLKFMIKKSETSIDYVVMPLEGLWWADDMASFSVDDKAGWKWTMMIMQPEFIDRKLIASAIKSLEKKKDLPVLHKIRFETYNEGLCAQTLHLGPFSEEGPTVARVHAVIEEHGKLTGKHHEIYLSDIRKAAPEKWKTVIRQPMLKK